MFRKSRAFEPRPAWLRDAVTDRVRDRELAPTLGLVFGLALAFHAGTGILGAVRAGIPFSELAAYFDGHLYLQVAKSFPLPYSGEGRSYLTHAPLYPALVWLVHLVVPSALAGWGTLAIWVAWLGSAAGAAAFYLLAREVGARPGWATAFYVLANPRWASIAATAHAEAVAMPLVILCLLAFSRRRLGWCVVWLSLASLARFPAILLGGPLAFGVLVLRRDFRIRNFAWLSLPLLVLALFQLYQYLRIPDFGGLLQEHSGLWEAHLVWPFQAFLEFGARFHRTFGIQQLLLDLSLAFYFSAILVGLRRGSGSSGFVLAGCVAILAFFHVSLSGRPAVSAFPRLVVLAWPAALLLHWRWLSPRLPSLAAAILAVWLGAVSLWIGTHQVAGAVVLQKQRLPYFPRVLETLEQDRPDWLELGGAAQRRR